jgi:hypothetical protein
MKTIKKSILDDMWLSELIELATTLGWNGELPSKECQKAHVFLTDFVNNSDKIIVENNSKEDEVSA